MTEEATRTFVRDMRAANSRLNRIEADTVECLVYAMRHTHQFEGNRWFGPLHQGTFFMCLDGWKWEADALPMEVLVSLEAEFGEELTQGLSYP